jgi:selenoprotein W-related protein
LEAYEERISELTIVPSGGGAFEVTVDGDLVFSKKSLGRHADHDEILSLVSEYAN